MRTYLKQLILVIVITFVGFQDVHSQFREFKGSICDGCIENTENVCRCKPTDGDLNHKWSKDEWADMGGGLGGVIRGIFEGKKARRRFVEAFERELGSELRNIVDIDKFNPNSDSSSLFGRRPPTPREVQLGLFNTWSLQNRITVPGQNNARIEYNNFVKQTNDFVKDFDRAATELNALEQRRQEIVAGNLDNAYLKFYSVEGQTLGSIKTLAALDNLLGKSRDKYLGLYNHLNPLRFSFNGNQARYNLVDGLKKMNYGLFEYHLANQYVREYEKFKKKDPYGAANRLRDFIMAHKSNFPLTFIGNAQISELHRALLNAGRVYYRSPNDAAYRETRKLGVGVPPHTPTPRSLEAIHENQVYENLGTAANDYIKSYPNVQEAIDKYFEHYDYNKASQDCVNYLFQKVLGDGDFAPDTNDYKSNRTPICRAVGTPNTAIDMQWKPSSIDAGYQGFQNIMAELNNIPQNHQKIGHVIKDILSANGKGLPNWMDDILVGRYFNFRLVPVNATGVQIDFKDEFGTNAWNDGLRDNDAVYNHIQRVEFVSIKLNLDTKQRKILLKASNFVSQLFNFLNSNADNPSAIDFGKDAVTIFNEGGDVDFDCSDPKPDKLSFCKKVWYLDKDHDGYYSEMKEAETRPGENWYENLTEEDCDDKDPEKKEKGDCFVKEDPCANKDLRNKKVSAEVQANEIDNRKHNTGVAATINEFGIQEIEDGTGDINVDKYELNITSLPSGMTAQELFEEIRTNFDNIVTGGNDVLSKARFGPYAPEDDSTWDSTNPIGSAMVFRTPLDNATVIATEYSLQEMFWTFTTVNSFDHWGHPVNGHRQFRLRENEDGSHTFVVRGADRLNTLFDFGANAVLGLGVNDFAFDLADDTWKNLMKTVEDFINAKPGAQVEPFDKNKEYGTRHPYNEDDCK